MPHLIGLLVILAMPNLDLSYHSFQIWVAYIIAKKGPLSKLKVYP